MRVIIIEKETGLVVTNLLKTDGITHTIEDSLGKRTSNGIIIPDIIEWRDLFKLYKSENHYSIIKKMLKEVI